MSIRWYIYYFTKTSHRALAHLRPWNTNLCILIKNRPNSHELSHHIVMTSQRNGMQPSLISQSNQKLHLYDSMSTYVESDWSVCTVWEAVLCPCRKTSWNAQCIRPAIRNPESAPVATLPVGALQSTFLCRQQWCKHLKSQSEFFYSANWEICASQQPNDGIITINNIIRKRMEMRNGLYVEEASLN